MNHRRRFIEFCRQELATGGPDPQIATLQTLSKKESLHSRVWLIGCYGAHHCVPSAYLVWKHWSPDKVLSTPRAFSKWIHRHWTGLPVRPEMRSHRMLEKRVECLSDFASLAMSYDPQCWSSYDDAWIGAQRDVKYFGRYMAIKVLEMLYRFGDSPHLLLRDMRARGGWSPRRCLALVWGSDGPSVLAERGNESPEALEIVERYFRRTRRLLRAQDVHVSCFQLQVLLCEYKEALAGGYYPGASIDEELSYIAKSQSVFGRSILRPVFHARKRTFPRQHVGELKGNGWNGPRAELFHPFKVHHHER